MLSFETAPAASVTPLPLLSLLRFQRLMQREGWPIDVQRMCLERSYACAQLALAHTSACEPLRKMALELFSTYDRNAENGTLH